MTSGVQSSSGSAIARLSGSWSLASPGSRPRPGLGRDPYARRGLLPERQTLVVSAAEKGGKLHDVPGHHNAEQYMDAYIKAAGIEDEKKGPLFRSLDRRKTLTLKPMARTDVLRMIKKRALIAGLPYSTCCHTFRATGITVPTSRTAALSRKPRPSPTTSRRERPSSTTVPATPSSSTRSRRLLFDTRYYLTHMKAMLADTAFSNPRMILKTVFIPTQDDTEGDGGHPPERRSFPALIEPFLASFCFLAPQAVGAVGKWKSCCWIPTFP